MRDSDWTLRPGDGIGPVELGRDRSTVLGRLRSAEIELEVDDEDPTYAEFDDEEITLWFEPELPHRLWQIDVSDERVRYRGVTLIGRRPHEVMQILGQPSSETLWRLHLDDADSPDEIDRDDDRDPTTVEDRDLFHDGMLWVRSLGLGIYFDHGSAATLLVRDSSHVPSRGIGSWTTQQEKYSQDFKAVELSRSFQRGAQKSSLLSIGLNVALIAALGFIVWSAIDFQRRWNEALVVEGVVVEVQPPPPDPFPSQFRVAYTDQQGQPHEVTWERADVYVINKVGETIEVRYLPETPEQGMGPARYRDAAFLVYVPYALGVVGAYLVLQLIVSVILPYFTQRRR